MDPELARMQYAHPSSLAGGLGQPSGDGGIGGFGGDNDDVSGDRYGGLKLWEAKYQFRKEMLPMFVGEAFGKKVCPLSNFIDSCLHDHCFQIFSTGKSLNFIRYSCHDSDWVVTREKMGNTGKSKCEMGRCPVLMH